jgi:hypothetical protein
VTLIDRTSNAFARPGSKRRILPIVIVTIGVILAIAIPAHNGAIRGSRPSVIGGRSGTVIHGDLAVASGYLGLTAAQLRSELRSGRTLAEVAGSLKGRTTGGLIDAILAARRATLQAAVARGELSGADERASLATLRGRVSGRVDRVGGYGPGGGVSGVPDLISAARYLGVPTVRLREQLLAGRTLARVASATEGKSAGGLIAALITDRRARLAAAVAAGRLTGARERALLAGLGRRVAAEAGSTRP